MKAFLSALSLVLLLQTTNAQLVTLPYEQNFDDLVGSTGSQIPTGWFQQNGNADPAVWDVIANSPNSPMTAHSAPNAMHMSFNASYSASDYLFTPGVEMTAGGSYVLTFWVRINDGGFVTSENLRVLATSDQDSTTQVGEVLIDLPGLTNNAYEEQTVTFVPTTSGVFYFAFHAYSEPFQFLLMVDDVSVTAMPSTSNDLIAN
jgi:Cleaved Adhesin Domain